MVVYAFKQRWEILRHYSENHGNVAQCVRKLRTDFGKIVAPLAQYDRYFVKKKLKETDILIDKPKHDKPKTVRTPENIAAVAESVCKVPSTSFSTIEHFGGIIETNFA